MIYRLGRHLYWMVTGLLMSIFLSGLLFGTGAQGAKAVASTPLATNSVPTITWQNAQLPDWNQITFGNLPGIQESGEFEAPPQVASQLKYDPSRSWKAGDKPDSYTKLGDFQDTFKLQDFNLQTIAVKVGLDLSQINLKQFGVINLQTLGSLVEAIPRLKSLPIQAVKPVLDLLTSQLNTDFNPSQTIGQLLQQSPILGELEFSNLPLDKYSLDSIPGLEATAIGAFKDWQGVNINQIPGLSNVPFSQFPVPANPIGADVGTVDIAFGQAEQQRNRSISGSDVEGFKVSCQQDCAHVELAGSAKVLGTQWISGQYQEVRGGHGALAVVNGGKEPTGRHPFGEAFKVVVWDISESQGAMSQALFFRVCIRHGFVDLGCTPYFIGPVPWLSYHEKDPIFLGAVDAPSGGSSTLNSMVANTAPATNTNQSGGKASSPNLSFLQAPGHGDCQKQEQGVVLDAFSQALSDIEGNYDSVGAYVCDSTGNCGRPLGSQQLMSYRQDVRSQISAKSGGKEFLAKVDSGAAVSGEEMLQYFPPADQKALFDADAKSLLDSAAEQIDPTTGQPFIGERLIQRAAQMYLAGLSIPIDAGVSDALGQLTVKSYGEKVASSYQQAFQAMGC